MPERLRDLVGYGILFVLTLGIAVVDAATGKDITVWALYLVPITLATAVGGLTLGLMFALFATAMLAVIGSSVGSPYPTGICFLIGLCNQALAFIGAFVAVSVIRKLIRERDRLLAASAVAASPNA